MSAKFSVSTNANTAGLPSFMKRYFKIALNRVFFSLCLMLWQTDFCGIAIWSAPEPDEASLFVSLSSVSKQNAMCEDML